MKDMIYAIQMWRATNLNPEEGSAAIFAADIILNGDNVIISVYSTVKQETKKTCGNNECKNLVNISAVYLESN